MTTVKDILLPDIGDFKDVDVIEVLVKPGDFVMAEDSLITLESDKATMEVPSPYTGTIKDIRVNVGDKVSQGSLILHLETLEDETGPVQKQVRLAEKAAEEKQLSTRMEKQAPPQASTRAADVKPQEPAIRPSPTAALETLESVTTLPHASPSIRRFARELGVDLTKVRGSGPKERILHEDVQAYVKGIMTQGGGPTTGFGLPAMPEIDFSKFGEIDTRPLSRIQQVSGSNLQRNWVTIPHVTQFDEADITELEEFRKAQTERVKDQGIKLSLLSFLIKAGVTALKQFPDFNSSLHTSGERLIMKKYFHIGVAVDTPQGLMVPVIRDVDKKGILDIARELGEISAKAREKGLSPSDMQGGCFSISSLGGIGGTAFTPIINAPEVAILGVSRAVMKPVYQNGEFAARLILPLSLSYDHRVIDGAKAARFIVFLSEVLSDIRHILL